LRCFAGFVVLAELGSVIVCLFIIFYDSGVISVEFSSVKIDTGPGSEFQFALTLLVCFILIIIRTYALNVIFDDSQLMDNLIMIFLDIKDLQDFTQLNGDVFALVHLVHSD
jgi:hypothetical protein